MVQQRPLHADGRKDRPGEHPESERAGMAEQRLPPGRQPDADRDDSGHRREQAERDPDQPQGRVHLVVPFSAFTRFGCAAM